MTKILPLDVFDEFFSAFSPHAVEYRGVVYPTVEHAYHAARYADQKIVEEICSAPGPSEAWSISQKYKAAQIPGFSERKVAVMKALMRAKCEQHEDVRRALLDSGDQEIRKHIRSGPPADGFWDDGEDGTGLFRY
jgi:ribA/ribD-fused uncharacterized protein